MRPKRWPASDRRVSLLGAEVPESSITLHGTTVVSPIRVVRNDKDPVLAPLSFGPSCVFFALLALALVPAFNGPGLQRVRRHRDDLCIKYYPIVCISQFYEPSILQACFEHGRVVCYGAKASE